jgi:hypothetical protein
MIISGRILLRNGKDRIKNKKKTEIGTKRDKRMKKKRKINAETNVE